METRGHDRSQVLQINSDLASLKDFAIFDRSNCSLNLPGANLASDVN